MRLEHGKKSSQRKMKPIELQFVPNWSGQGGVPYITFEGDDGKWYMLHLDSIDEAKQLLSQAHIAYGNVCDEEALKELKRSFGIRKPVEQS